MSKRGEHLQQCAVIDWFRRVYPVFSGCLFSIPNGTHLQGDKVKRAIQMNNLKKEGFKNGVSDLFLALPSLDKCGLWLEMKDEGATYSSVIESQRYHIALMNNVGYHAIWCAGASQAIKELQSYMNSVNDIKIKKRMVIDYMKSEEL